MSTNGFISFVANGESKHAYNHWDSMPDVLGITVLHWLREASREPDALRRAVTNLKLVGYDERPYPTEADVARFHMYSDRGVGDPNTSWYALLRGTQGEPADILACGYVVDDYDEPFGYVYEINWMSKPSPCFSLTTTGRPGHGRPCPQIAGSWPKRTLWETSGEPSI